jgi:hypothetical protein
MSKVEKECDNQSRSWGDKPPAQTVSELWKMGKAGTNSSPGVSKKNTSCRNFNFGSQDSFWTSDLQKYKIIYLY